MQKALRYFFPFLLGLLLAGCFIFLFHTVDTEKVPKTPATGVGTSTDPYRLDVRTDDDAVRAYLLEAQLHAEIYRYTNNGSYAGMCELIDTGNHFTLEQGVLRYIKAVGATGVYCATSESTYMIEAKLPGSDSYYCIDSYGHRGEQPVSHKSTGSCGA